MFSIPSRFAGIKRFEQILSVLTRHGMGHLAEKAGFKQRKLFAPKKIGRPIELRIILEELGGSFVKLGQFLSLRPDLIPKEYCEELSRLQDSVEPFPYSEVEHVIRKELGQPIGKLFRKFDKKPIAAASIGQVHKATLKDGSRVAVKVMRPGVAALFHTDLEILEYFSKVVKHRLSPEVFDPEEIFAEFKRYTEGELDYLKEARNIKLFRSERGAVKIPAVHDHLTTKRVLTMELIEGTPLHRIIREPGRYRVNRKQLSKLLAESFMEQIFIKGVFHADPHPGNVLATKGGIGLLDFGIVGRVDEDMRETLDVFLMSMVGNDLEGVVRCLMELNLVDADVDSARLKQDISDSLSEYYDVALDRIDIIDAFIKSISIARKYGVKVSRDYVLLVKCLVTLRSVCLELNPEFNIIQEARPFMQRMARDRSRPKNVIRRLYRESSRFASFIHGLPEQSRRFSSTLNKADLALSSINSDLRSINSELRIESWRFVVSIICAALIIGAAITYQTDRSISNIFVLLSFSIMAYLLFSMMRDGFRRLA